MIITNDSHLDHGIPEHLVAWIAKQFAGEKEFFACTVLLPGETTLPCGLYGPVMGDEPVAESEVTYGVRGARRCASRLCKRPMRPDRRITVIGGPDERYACVLYTAFGGPLAPRELGDPEIETWAEYSSAKKFWAEHALAMPE